jgi:hypothetical protein
MVPGYKEAVTKFPGVEIKLRTFSPRHFPWVEDKEGLFHRLQ